MPAGTLPNPPTVDTRQWHRTLISTVAVTVVVLTTATLPVAAQSDDVGPDHDCRQRDGERQ